jgi:hypothetical protein
LNPLKGKKKEKINAHKKNGEKIVMCTGKGNEKVLLFRKIN